MAAKFIILITVGILAAGTSVAQTPIFGIAQARDGDSLEVNGIRIRLFGIDAPELNQTCDRAGAKWPCGEEAYDNLSRLVTGRDVRCSRLGKDQFDRVLAKCTINGLEINRTMVERGYATAFRKYSNEYVGSENRAKAAGLGIWSGEFRAPAEVRAEGWSGSPSHSREGRSRSVVSSIAASSSNCRIKGNHSRKGEWIYHVPGMPYYEQTRAEAMFCTEAEARAAGYRRARTR